MVNRNELVSTLSDWLQPDLIKDYCPNGLQVEGKAEIKTIVCGVTASEALIDKAIKLTADAIMVHHGYFWKSESAAVVGMKKRRLSKLLNHDINLLAYHLPLDVHPTLGNNIGLAEQLELEVEGQVSAGGTQNLLWYGRLPQPMTASELGAHVSHKLNRLPLVIAPDKPRFETIAWCTGGAQGFIDDAAALGVDVYLSGEVSEPTTHSAREQGVAYVAAGHHATERYGIQLLAKAVEKEFGVSARYCEVSNPA